MRVKIEHINFVITDGVKYCNLLPIPFNQFL